MDTSQIRATTVLGPLGEDDVWGLVFSTQFTAYRGGDPARVKAMLAAVAAAPGARLTVALDPLEGVVGFCSVLPPVHGERFSPVSSALELVAAEVVRRYRRRGLFAHMFQSAIVDVRLSTIVYAIVDPMHRDDGETKRRFRERMEAVLGSVGFFPYPSTYGAAHVHRDSSLFVRRGEDVPDEDFQHFLDLLASTDTPVTVGIMLEDRFLRDLVRTDLERNGLTVVSVASYPSRRHADVYVTGPDGPAGDVLSVRLVDADEARFRDGVVWMPTAEVENLAHVVRREVARRRSTKWLKSSSSG